MCPSFTRAKYLLSYEGVRAEGASKGETKEGEREWERERETEM